MSLKIKKECVKPLLETKFIKVADLQYAEGCHYFNATRRSLDDLVATRSDEEFRDLVADAVTAAVILKVPGDEPRLVLSYEYRYPAGRFLLSPPAGLIDPKDAEAGIRFCREGCGEELAAEYPFAAFLKTKDPAEAASLLALSRELYEETGIRLSPGDSLFTVNPLLFSTPGMTDESNAIVCAVIENADVSVLSQAGAVGGELFDGFALVTEDEARDLILRGRDVHGNFYSAYTWIVLMYFLSGLWKQAR